MQCSVWVQTRQSMIQYPQTGCHQTFRLTQEESQTWWQKANRTRDGHGCNIFIPKLGQDTSPCAAQGNKERYVLKPPQVVRVGSKKVAHGEPVAFAIWGMKMLLWDTVGYNGIQAAIFHVAVFENGVYQYTINYGYVNSGEMMINHQF